MTGLSIAYFLTHWIMKTRKSNPGWQMVLHNSSVILGALLALACLGFHVSGDGWYILALTLLFTFDILTSQRAWLEGIIALLSAIACYLLYRMAGIRQVEYLLAIIALVLLSLDLLFSRTIKRKRPWRWPVRLLGGLSCLFVTILLIFFPSLPRATESILLLGFAVFFLGYALVYRRPRLGAISALFPPLAILALLRALELQKWLFPLIGVAVIYYLIGIILVSRKPESS